MPRREALMPSSRLLCARWRDRLHVCTHSLSHAHNSFYCLHKSPLLFRHTHTHTSTFCLSLLRGLMGTRSRSVGAPVHPTFWSSPRTLRLTWLWMVVWPESCSQTMGSATSTLTTCTACLPPWLVCTVRECLVRTVAVRKRIRENERLYLTMQVFWSMKRNILVFMLACTNHTICFGPTGLPISRSDHREDVREQHQSHLCCNQPCGSFVPGQELCRSHRAHSALYPVQARFKKSKWSVFKRKLREWQIPVVNHLILNILLAEVVQTSVVLNRDSWILHWKNANSKLIIVTWFRHRRHTQGTLLQLTFNGNIQRN